MIVGVGVDVVDVGRIASLMRRYGRRFLERILTSLEIEACIGRHDQAQHIAGRFAAKEAALKALSIGMFSGIGFRDVLIEADGSRPRLVFAGKALEAARAMQIKSSFVSISHDGGLAVAVVVLERS